MWSCTMHWHIQWKGRLTGVVTPFIESKMYKNQKVRNQTPPFLKTINKWYLSVNTFMMWLKRIQTNVFTKESQVTCPKVKYFGNIYQHFLVKLALCLFLKVKSFAYYFGVPFPGKMWEHGRIFVGNRFEKWARCSNPKKFRWFLNIKKNRFIKIPLWKNFFQAKFNNIQLINIDKYSIYMNINTFEKSNPLSLKNAFMWSFSVHVHVTVLFCLI